MTKKQHTLYGGIGLVLGVIGGIAGTAFSMGEEQQRVRGQIMTIEIQQENHEKGIEKEMDRYAEIIAAHITQLTENVTRLNTTVGELRSDVQVLKALIERMERDIQTRMQDSVSTPIVHNLNSTTQ